MEGVLFMEFQGVSPINAGQVKAAKLLDNHKPFTFITGAAGTGKTLLAGAVALERVLNKPKEGYKKIIYTRLQIQSGVHIGYIPGDFEGKTDPFIHPFKDNFQEMDYTLGLDYLLSGKDKKLEFVPIQIMRGRTFPNSILIIDEAQNLDTDTITTIATRLGQSSKMIFLSNFAQIDDETNTLKSPDNNGLYQLLSTFYKADISYQYFDHVHLTDVERSEAAAFVERIMRHSKMNPAFKRLEEKGIADLSNPAAIGY